MARARALVLCLLALPVGLLSAPTGIPASRMPRVSWSTRPGSVATRRAPDASPSALHEWEREHVRRKGVTSKFQLMQNMVQSTWAFVLCALPLAIQHPSLRYQFMGVACRMFAGATAGVVVLGSGQLALQGAVTAVLGLPECWQAASQPIAETVACLSTGWFARALFHGPFSLAAPAAGASIGPGGMLLNLVLLEGFRQQALPVQNRVVERHVTAAMEPRLGEAATAAQCPDYVAGAAGGEGADAVRAAAAPPTELELGGREAAELAADTETRGHLPLCSLRASFGDVRAAPVLAQRPVIAQIRRRGPVLGTLIDAPRSMDALVL